MQIYKGDKVRLLKDVSKQAHIKKGKVETILSGDYANSYISMRDMDIKRNHN